MDQHILEEHYSNVEANEISLSKATTDRLQNMALEQGVRTLQCDVCPFKIRKEEKLFMIRRQMDQHMFEKHYLSFEANKISLSKETADRLRKIAAKRNRTKPNVAKSKKKEIAGQSSKIFKTYRSTEDILSSNKLFECPHCNLQFINKNHLSRHVNTGCVHKEGIKFGVIRSVEFTYIWLDGEMQQIPISKSIYEAPTEQKVTNVPTVKTQTIRKLKAIPKLRKLTDDEIVPKIH